MLHNNQHHRKILLSRFHLKGKHLGFHPQTQKKHMKLLLSSFHGNGHTVGFHPGSNGRTNLHVLRFDFVTDSISNTLFSQVAFVWLSVLSEPNSISLIVYSLSSIISREGSADSYSFVFSTCPNNLPVFICIGNSMICSDIWHKYYEWYFKIVTRNFTSH